MNFKKTSLEGRMVDVVSLSELENHRDIYSNGSTGVEVNKGNKKYILPYRSDNTKLDKPGVYKISDKAQMDIIVYPEKRNESQYQPEVIDFSNSSSMQDYMSKREKCRDIEREILTSPDNIFKPHIEENDTPEMKGLKKAILAKNIDIDKYADRFGENFPNDKRKMKDNKITLFLLKRMCEGLDMKAELIISDVSPSVPNPIGNPIHIQLTNNNIIEDDEDNNGEKKIVL